MGSLRIVTAAKNHETIKSKEYRDLQRFVVSRILEIIRLGGQCAWTFYFCLQQPNRPKLQRCVAAARLEIERDKKLERERDSKGQGFFNGYRGRDSTIVGYPKSSCNQDLSRWFSKTKLLVVLLSYLRWWFLKTAMYSNICSSGITLEWASPLCLELFSMYEVSKMVSTRE